MFSTNLSLRRKALRLLVEVVLWCVVVIVLPINGVAGNGLQFDRYVSPSGRDSNNGSRQRPWRTLQHAAEAARPGMTIHVAPGTYAGPVNTSKSGISDARIRLISDTKWGAAIVSTGGANVWTNTGNYVDIAGFDIRGDGAIGIMNRGSQVRIIANHVHDIPAAHCTMDGGAGIDDGNYEASDDDIIGNVVHDIGEGPGSCNRVHGIYHSNLRGHIYNNVVYRNASFGIHLWHAATNVVIANNTVVGNGGTHPGGCTGGGIVVGAGDSPGGVVNDYSTVVNNIVYDNGCVGIVEYCYGGQDCTGPHNQYRNNLVYGNAVKQVSLRNGLNATQMVSADPRLLNVQQGAIVDFHLQSSSPAIGRATGYEAPSVDIDGGPRPVGSSWDIGASEFRAPAANWPWF